MIQVHADAESLSRAAAERLVAEANQAVSERGRFSVALSGGSTPKRVFELLAQPPLRDRVPWPKFHLFWGDERCVPADDSRSNYRMTRLALLDHVPVPANQVHPIDGGLPPETAAQQYESLLKAFFTASPPRFDLVMLGLGGNGHTASLFPHTPVLDESTRWVRPVNILHVQQLERSAVGAGLPELMRELQRVFEITLDPALVAKVQSFSDGLALCARELADKKQVLDRVTFTAPMLNQAAQVIFLVAGSGKADVLRDVVEGKRDPHRLPAQLIQPANGKLDWLVDRAAASQLAGH